MGVGTTFNASIDSGAGHLPSSARCSVCSTSRTDRKCDVAHPAFRALLKIYGLLEHVAVLGVVHSRQRTGAFEVIWCEFSGFLRRKKSTNGHLCFAVRDSKLVSLVYRCGLYTTLLRCISDGWIQKAPRTRAGYVNPADQPKHAKRRLVGGQVGFMTTQLLGSWAWREHGYDTFLHVQTILSVVIASGAIILSQTRVGPRGSQLRFADELLEANPSMDLGLIVKLYNVDVRQAVLWSIESWNALSKTTFVNCWKKTGLLKYCTCDYAGPDEEDGITEELTAMISRLLTSNPMSVLELLNPPEENVLMEDPTDEDFCRVEDKHDDENRCGAVGDGANTVDDENEAAFVAPTPDNLTVEELKERLRWMAQLFVSADAMEVSSGTVSGLRSMQRAFREELGRCWTSSAVLQQTVQFHS